MKSFVRVGTLGLAALMMLATVSLAQEKPAAGGEAPKPAGGEAPKPADGENKPAPARPSVPITRPGETSAENAFTVKGTVVNAEGKPVAGALVGTQVSVVDGVVTVAGKPAPTGDDGSFSVTADKRMLAARGLVLLAITADGAHVGHVSVAKSADPATVGTPSITLSKTTKVTGSISAEGLDAETAAAVGMATLKAGDAEIMFQMGSAKGNTFTLYLPKGEFELRIGSRSSTVKNLNSNYVTIKVDGAKAEMSVGEQKLAPGPLHSGIGKPAPELSVTLVRGTTGKTLADFKGKWLLIDFWGVW